MNKNSKELKKYFHLKKQLYSFLLMTEESAKVFSAIEELDSLIDFIDVQLELNKYHPEEVQNQKNNQQSEKEIFQLLHKERNTVGNIFDNAVEKLISLLEKNKRLDPIIFRYKNQTKVYLKFKKIVNTISPTEKQSQLNDLATNFFKSYSLLEQDNLSILYGDAIQELKLNLGKRSEQLLSKWHKAITFCDRTILENEGLFRIQHEKRHFLFSNMLKKLRERKDNDTDFNESKKNIINPDVGNPKSHPINSSVKSKKESKKSSFYIILKEIFREFSQPYKDFEETNINSLYITQKLDHYLYVRDLRMNLTRKWARFIPLQMSHYIIKFYNDPYYWDDNHFFLADVDYLRLGFSYYQYSMEMGKDSEYFPMIYKKALNCFRKGKIGLPDGLKEKLAFV